MQNLIDGYFDELRRLADGVAATDGEGRDVGIAEAIGWTIESAKATHAAGNKLMFVGNGGSAAIAGHMAIDYSKNGGLRAMAFNDGAALTCLGNDLGYDQVFACQIEWHARPGDLLIAISSSGRSANILNAVAEARRRDCRILTLSGFGADNPLRRLGERNLYVASHEYGFVEISHLALCHSVLDLAMGWRPDR